MIRANSLFLALIAALALGTGVWLGQALIRPPAEAPLEIAGVYLAEPKPVTPFVLTDQSGGPYTQDDLKGVWSFLYFGYTYCPDACPMTLAELNLMQRQLAERGLDQDTAYRLISVDPARDTPERLGAYTAYFNPKFRGATGTPEELTRLARQLGVYFAVAPGWGETGDYTVDHSSTVILIDPDGRLCAVFTDHAPERLVADFVKIRERYSAAH